MKKFTTTVALGAATVFATAAMSAAQTVLYSDSFNRTSGMGDATGGVGDSDWGMNDNALGGSLQSTYFVGPERAGGANQVVNQEGVLVDGGAFLNLDASVGSPLGFTVAFDFDRFYNNPAGQGNGFIAVGLGVDATATDATIGGSGFVVNNSDTAVLFQQGAGGNVGNGQVFTDDSAAPAFGNAFDYGDPTAVHSVLLTVVPQIAGLYGSADLVDINVTVDGNSLFDYTTLGGDNFGSFAVSSNSFTARSIDNLVVSSIVPEPTSLALIGLGGLAALRRRR